MALAEGLHHSAQRPEKARAREVEEQDQQDALRRQTAPSPGKRPEPLVEVSEPQAGIRRHTVVGFEPVLVPVVPQLAREDERQVAEEWVELVDEHTGKAYFWNPLSYRTSWSRPKRKRKKRRKRRTPRSSSYSSYGRARRRKRQWHALNAGFPGDVPLRAVFPSVVARPEMSGITAGMDQKDNVALIVDSGSGMCKARFPGYDAPCVMFPSGVAKPRCSASWPVWTRLTVTTWCPWSRLQKTAVSPQLQSIQVIDISFVVQRQFPMVQTSKLTTEVPQLPFVYRWSMPFLCRSCLPYLLLSMTGAQGSDSAEHRRGPAVAVHQVRRQFPVVVRGRCPCLQLVQILRWCLLKTVEIPQLRLVFALCSLGCRQARGQVGMTRHNFAIGWFYW